MRQDLVEIEERKICNDRSANFRGTAAVALEVLDFDIEGDRDDGRDNGRDNEKRLKSIFEDKGCWRLEPENRISAIIDQQSLDDAIQASPAGTTLATLLENPRGIPPELRLPPNHRLKCLQGRSRVQAAKAFLSPEERSWAIDLYLEDASPELRTTLAEQYSNAAKPHPGEIYRNIRKYQGNIFAEGRWRALLSGNQQKELKQFLRHGTFVGAFDALLAIPGLWFGFSISLLPKIIALKCDEEILHYLRHILDVWSWILHEDRQLMRQTGRTTVEALQLRVPGLCSEDSEFLESLMTDGVLFPGVKNQEERQRIWQSILQVRMLIPSICTLFKDIKSIIPQVKAMKRLLGKPFEGSVGEAMEQNFSGVNQIEGEVKVQETESSFRSYRGNLADQKHFGIFQLWLFLARNFDDLIPDCPRGEEKQDTPVPKPPDTSAWRAFATLAYNLGFECEEIHRLRSKNSDREKARTALLGARDPQRFKYEETAFESFQSQIANMFGTAVELFTPPTIPNLFTRYSGEGIQRRCGRTFENAYKYDRQCLFLEAFYPPAHVGGRGITSLFVRVSVQLSFFGERVSSSGDGIIALTASLKRLGSHVGSNIPVLSSHQGPQVLAPPHRSEQEAELREETERLQSELTRMAQEMEKLQEQNSNMDHMIRQLKEESSDLRNQVTDQDTLYTDLERLCHDEARAREELDEFKRLAATDVEELTKEVVALRSQHVSEAAAVTRVLSDNENLSAVCAELEQKLETFEAAESDICSELRRENEELKSANTRLQQSLEQSEEIRSDALNKDVIEKQELLGRLEQLGKEVQNLSTQKKGLEQNLRMYEVKQSDTSKEWAAKHHELSARNKELRSTNVGLQQDLEKSKAQSDDLNARASSLEKDLASLRKEHTKQIEEANRTMQEKLTEAVNEREDIRQRFNSKLSENETLREAKNRLGAKVDLLEKELARLREEANWLIMSRSGDQKIPVPNLQEKDNSHCLIKFQIYQNGHIEDIQSLVLDAAGLERIGKKYAKEGIHLHTINCRGVMPENAFKTVVKNGTYTILLIPESEEVQVKKIRFNVLTLQKAKRSRVEEGVMTSDAISDNRGIKEIENVKKKAKKSGFAAIPGVSNRQ